MREKHNTRGQIIPRGKDKFLISVYIGRDTQGKKHYWSQMVKGTLTDAKKRLTEKLNEKDGGQLIKASRMTLNDYLDKWLETSVRNRVRPNTLHHYRERLKFQVRPYLGNYRLESISPMHVQNLVNELHRQGIASTTVKKVHTILSGALKQAVKWRILQSNPADGIKVARESKDESRRHLQTLTAEQARTFLNSLRGDHYYPLFLLALVGGLRPSEILGLRWHDVDFDRDLVKVQTVLIRRRDGGGWYFGEPKTRRGRRSIPFPPFVMDALREHRQRQDEWRAVYGSGYNDHSLVFATNSGLPIDLRNLRAAFRGRMTRAELPTGLRLYDLRHSCASLLLGANVHPKVVSERLGHASVNLTLDVYSHVLPTMQAEASTQLGRMLSDKLATD